MNVKAEIDAFSDIAAKIVVSEHVAAQLERALLNRGDRDRELGVMVCHTANVVEDGALIVRVVGTRNRYAVRIEPGSWRYDTPPS
jgi:hypothetical protein